MKLPFCKFYPRDWMGDTQLRGCSYAARGLWADLLCVMGMNERRGYLEVSGKAITEPVQIAKFTNGTEAEVTPLLAELDQAGIFSRDGSGCIFSRRMVSDAERSEAGRQFGLSGGNPLLKGDKVKATLNPRPYGSPLNLEIRDQRSEIRDQRSEAKDIGENATKSKAAVAAPAAQSDSDWIAGLKSDPAYQGIDVATEHAKMVNWCKVNHKPATRKRFINWLHRVDRPLTAPTLTTAPAHIAGVQGPEAFGA
jgi:hypothetical protein